MIITLEGCLTRFVAKADDITEATLVFRVEGLRTPAYEVFAQLYNQPADVVLERGAGITMRIEGRLAKFAPKQDNIEEATITIKAVKLGPADYEAFARYYNQPGSVTIEGMQRSFSVQQALDGALLALDTEREVVEVDSLADIDILDEIPFTAGAPTGSPVIDEDVPVAAPAGRRKRAV